jgi:hypothetical protein
MRLKSSTTKKRSLPKREFEEIISGRVDFLESLNLITSQPRFLASLINFSSRL